MRSFTNPWNLRRSFGSQALGGIAGSPWPEAGIAAQVIPARRSRWTVREGADLPTCRPADLPTLVVDDHQGAGPRTLFCQQLRCIQHLQR
jgi:hypothetical protein